MRFSHHRLFLGLVLCATFSLAADAATTFGPTSYLQHGDTPTEFYSELCDLHIEDFEDNVLDPFLTIDNGFILPPNSLSGLSEFVTDSVDGDDGVVDGNGNGGYSWFTGTAGAADRTLTITFASTVTSAGLVFTDGDSASTEFTLEAFDIHGNSLGILDAGALADPYFTGQTAEDSFLGFRDETGIAMLTFSMNAGTGIEIDHIHWQDCEVIPEPSTLGMFGLATLGLLSWRRRR